MYPAVFTSKKKILFLSIDKFYFKNSTLVEPSYSFLEDDITKEAIIFIDEFDASKDRILNKIIDEGKDQQLDFLQLFTTIYWALANNELPQQFILASQSEQKLTDDELELDNIASKLLAMATEIVEDYKLEYSFKTDDSDLELGPARNLLFHDFQYHSIYRSDKKFIKLNVSEPKKLNEISFVDKDPEDDKSIIRLLNRIKGFIKYFNGSVKYIAQNYQKQKQKERKANPFKPEFTFEAALSSVLEEFNLKTEYKKYIIDHILRARNRTKPKASGNLNYDLSFYENGFRYYDFVDDDNHQSKTKIFISNFQNTPEKFILKLAEKAKVVGISATALAETLLGNYDLEYFKSELGDKFIELSDAEKETLAAEFKQLNQNYGKIKIHTEWFSSICSDIEIDQEFTDLLGDEELARDIIGKFRKKYSEHNTFTLSRYLKIGHAFKNFLLKKDLKGFLCLLNKFPKDGEKEPNSKDFNIENLEYLFKVLIEDVTETQDLFEDELSQYDVSNAYTIVKSYDFEKQKEEFRKKLESDNKIFIISTYQTIGSGQNLQFKAPHPEKLINVQDSSIRNWNTKKETDLNGIYLEKPSHLLELIDEKLDEAGFVRYLFQLEFLLEAGGISAVQLKEEVKRAFKALLASGGNFKSKNDLYGTKDMQQFYAKQIIQALGRICRTNLKSKNIYVYADQDLDPCIRNFDLDGKLVVNEFKALVESVSKAKTETKSELEMKNKANTASAKAHNAIKKFINREWKWSKEDIKEWNQLRQICLRFPTFSPAQIKAHNLNPVRDLYIELPDPNNTYFYRQEEDYKDVEVCFNRDKAESPVVYEVSRAKARLEEFFQIPGLKAHFEAEKWATEFKPAKFILTPILFNNIYKGALGEEVGKYILENVYHTKLEPLPAEHFELFDFKVKNSNVFIDFKNWRETTRADAQDQHKKIRAKLETVKGDKVFIINILFGDYYHNKVTVSSDKKIVEVPYLWHT